VNRLLWTLSDIECIMTLLSSYIALVLTVYAKPSYVVFDGYILHGVSADVHLSKLSISSVSIIIVVLVRYHGENLS